MGQTDEFLSRLQDLRQENEQLSRKRVREKEDYEKEERRRYKIREVRGFIKEKEKQIITKAVR